MIRILLLNNRDRAFAAGGVNALAGLIVEDVVRVPNCRDGRDHLAAGRIENHHAGRRPADHDQPVIGFIEGHRKIRLRPAGHPRGHNRFGLAIDDRDLFRPRQIHENPAAVLFELERLRMRVQLDVRCLPALLVDRAECAAPVSDPDLVTSGVVAEIVRVVSERD